MFTCFQKLPIVCLFAAAPALAQEELAFYALPPVFVSSTQTAVLEKDQPFSTTVINAEQIRQSGYTTVRDVLSKLALVNVRTPLDGSRSASVDLRGFGETASANVVFVVDGVKLNDNEGVTPRYGSIPVSSIETIEVIRGGSSVAYGSGASGGVIRITTKKGRGRDGVGGDVFASYGSYDTKELGATLYGGANGFSLVFNGSKEFTNGYRDNSEASRDLGSLALDWQGDVYSAGASFSAEGSKSRFPGSLNRAQFEQNPKQTNTPNDFGSFERNTFRFYGAADYGNWGTGVRVSRRTHEALGVFSGSSFVSGYEQDQISPYIGFTLPQLAGVHEIRIGYDREKSAIQTQSVFPSTPIFNAVASGSLESSALFVEDDWLVNERLRINFGSRYERAEQTKGTGETREYSLQAHQIGYSFNLTEQLATFSKFARSYRISNFDENTFAGASTGTSAVPFLEPQVANEIEVGLRSVALNGEFTGSLFLMEVDNEILFDPTRFQNINLDELRRQGAELKWSGQLFGDFRLTAAYQYIDAEFKAGQQVGERVPLVAAHNLKLTSEYDFNAQMAVEAVLNTQSNQRSASNNNLQIPGYGVVDLNWRYRADSYSAILQLQNMFDKQYYRTQFSANGIYPETGRTLSVSFNAEF
ncbi:MAG: TonB-dependent receptor [Pseudomonadota bacterium]